MADYHAMLEEHNNVTSLLHEATYSLVALQKIRISQRSDEQKDSMADLVEDKANYLSILTTL